MINKISREYDFSNEGANTSYTSIENGIQKFFAYMTVMKKDKFNYEEGTDELFINATKIVNENTKDYGKIKDPDSKSKLLQDIYRKLWDDKYLKFCIKDNGKIQGETLNSINTTLNVFYEKSESSDEVTKRKNLKIYTKEKEIIKEHKQLSPSITYIISKYLTKDKSSAIDKINKNNDLEKLMRVYHTLGNFMPVPVDCNSPRGYQNNEVNDYWDLTLYYIKDFYINNNDSSIKKIVKNKAKDYMGWLISFGKGKAGYENFIKENYLEAFVDINNNYEPKELWDNHFSLNENNKLDVLPQSTKQCNQYFERASNCILNRGKQMVDELEKIINESCM